MSLRPLWAIAGGLAVGLPAAVLVGVYGEHGSLGAASLIVLAAPAAAAAWLPGWVRGRRLASLLCVLGAGSWGTVGYAAWEWSLYGQTLRNLEVLKAHGRALGSYRQVHGAYPEDLTAVPARTSPPEIVSGTDAWERPLRYQRVGDGFLLVSDGRGGEADGIDYRADREARRRVETCGDWSADQVLSERGFHRICGK